MNKIKKGDYVYKFDYDGNLSRSVITRVNKLTYQLDGYYLLNKETLQPSPRDKWVEKIYFLETPELRKQFEKELKLKNKKKRLDNVNSELDELYENLKRVKNLLLDLPDGVEVEVESSVYIDEFDYILETVKEYIEEEEDLNEWRKRVLY